jgi:quinoprotein glucose dehydrogenase
LGRLHGLWGLAQLHRRGVDTGVVMMEYLGDSDAEVRAQSAKMLGDIRHEEAGELLVGMLEGFERDGFTAVFVNCEY